MKPISDHYLVYSVLNLKILMPHHTYVIIRSYKHYNHDSLVNDLAQVPRIEISITDDVNEKLDLFNYNFLEVQEKHAPLKTMKIRYLQSPSHAKSSAQDCPSNWQ